MKNQRFCSIIIISIIIFTLTIKIHPQGWEWQNPLPQGNRLGDVQFVDMNYGWISAGSNLLRTTNSGLQWDVEYVGHSFGPNSIHFVDDLNGWGVGSGIPPFIVKTIDGGITWEDLPIPEERDNGNYYNFWDVFFVDTLTGYFCDDKGGIFKCTDGGEEWIRVYQHLPRRELKSIFFKDSLSGWAIGNYLPIFKTTDAGNTWEKDSSIVSINGEMFQKIIFADSLNGWVKNTYDFYKTTDGGMNWEEIIVDTAEDGQLIHDFYFYELDAYDSQHLWLSTTWGVYFSSDGGTTWENILEDLDFRGIKFLNLNEGWATGNEPLKIENKYYKTTDGGFTWEDQTFSISDKSLTGVSFVDEIKGWAVGLGGVIMQTTNGGVNWQLQESGVNDRLTDVKFWNENFGLIAAENGKILNTTNGGQTWTASIVREGFRFEEISFVSPTNIWIAGWNWNYEGKVLHSTDGGISWEDQTPENADRLFSVSFIDSLNGWVTSGGGTIYDIGRAWNTNNGGNSWSLVIDGPYWAFEKVRFVDTLTGWIASANDLLRTTDGGTYWEVIEDITSYYITDFTIIDKSKCWVTSQFGQIVYSENGGETWKDQKNKMSDFSLRKIEFINENIGWAVGDFGSILHTESSGITSIKEQPRHVQVPLNFELYPNYPNPFNPSTTLSYRLKDNGTVRLVIYDIKGEKVTELVNEYQQAGYYEVNWDAKAFGLSSGIYLFRIEVKNENNIPVFSDVRKSILLK